LKLARISAERSDHMEDAVDGGDDNAVSAVLGGGSGDDTAEQTLDAAEIVRGAPGAGVKPWPPRDSAGAGTSGGASAAGVSGRPSCFRSSMISVRAASRAFSVSSAPPPRELTGVGAIGTCATPRLGVSRVGRHSPRRPRRGVRTLP